MSATSTPATTKVSVDSARAEGKDSSIHPTISADGRFVTYFLLCLQSGPGDSNDMADVFVHQYLPDPSPPTTTTSTTTTPTTVAPPPDDTDHFGDDDGNIFEDDINAIAEAGITRGCNPPRQRPLLPRRLLHPWPSSRLRTPSPRTPLRKAPMTTERRTRMDVKGITAIRSITTTRAGSSRERTPISGGEGTYGESNHNR